MAVQAGDGGGDGAVGEVSARAELEIRKEREMGGEIERIACGDGDENDGSGTDGSFVMVINGGDLDARSDSSEKDMDENDHCGDRGAGDLRDANSDTSFVDEVVAEKGGGEKCVGRRENEGEEERKLGDTFSVENDGKGDDLGGGDDEAIDSEGTKKILGVTVDPEISIEESAKTDLVQKAERTIDFEGLKNEVEDEEQEMVIVEVSNDGSLNQVEEDLVAVEDYMDETDAVIEDLNDKEVLDSKDLNNDESNHVGEEVVVVEYLKHEKDAVFEDLNTEDEAMAVKDLKNEELNQVEEEVVNVVGLENEKEIVNEYLNDEDESLAVKELKNEEQKQVKDVIAEDSKNAGESAIENLNKQDEEIKGTQLQADGRTEVHYVQNDAGSKNEGLIIENSSGQSSSSALVDRDIKLESAFDKQEAVESAVTEPPNTEIENVSEINESNKASEQKTGDVDSYSTETKESNTASEIEERSGNDEAAMEINLSDLAKEELNSAFEIEDRRDYNHEKCEDKTIDSNSESEERKNTNDEGFKDVESKITDHMNEKLKYASEVGDGNAIRDDSSNCIDSEKKQNSFIQVDETTQIKAAATVSDGEVEEPLIEQETQQDNASLPTTEIEENGHDSSVELIDERVKNNRSSASISEEFQVAETSSISQITEPSKVFISSTSRAEDKDGEALIPVEDMDLAHKVDQNQVLDASFIDSCSEPIKQCSASTSELEKVHATDNSSLDLFPEYVKENTVSSSKFAEIQNEEALLTEGKNENRDPKSTSELTDAVTEPVTNLEELEHQRKELLMAEEKVVDENKELKSAIESTEHMKIHLDKDLGEKNDSLNIQQQQDNAASAPDADGEKADILVKKYRMIKIPRLTQRVINDELRAKIDDSQKLVDEHTKNRDTLKAELDKMRKVLSDYFHKRDSANEEEKKAKALVNAKRQEMDSIQTVVSKGKTAASYLDIISQIQTLEHKMQHETISLKDEKKYLHELNQLKHERELHLFNKCSQLEIDEAIKQKEAAESSLKTLKREFDMLRSAHLKADECVKAASKSYIDQFNKVKEQEQKWKAANELRQNAYKNLHGLKSDKMEHYWKYMEDRQTAKKYASSRDMESLDRHCAEQIERIMKLWNEDDDFRRQYVESNAINTVRKFGTLDGRTPGPNDAKPVLPSRVSLPPVTGSSSASTTIPLLEEKSFPTHKITKKAQPSNQSVESKASFSSTLSSVAVSVPSPQEEFVKMELEKKLTEEVEEAARVAREEARKEEEMRKEREELELKENLRMEQKVKAKEAEERKKRKAEKARARAEYKAQKEAELREQKKAKKEKKYDKSSENARSMEADPVSLAETSSQEASLEREGSNRTGLKRTRKVAAALNKYTGKAQPVPLPLRNRGKRKMAAWMWTACIVVAIIGLFFAGNHISFNVSWLNFGF